MYEADANALKDIPVGRTLEEARALGPIVTPKQYQCSYCGTGACGVVVNTIQCLCGTNQCQPNTPATTSMTRYYLHETIFFIVLYRSTTKSLCHQSM